MPDQRRAKAAAHPGQQPADHIQRPVHAEIDTGPGDGGGNGHQQGAGPQAMPEQEGQAKVKLTVPWSLGKESSAAWCRKL